MAKLFTKLIERHKSKQYNKPKYPIKKLYVGNIVRLKRRVFVQIGVHDNYYKRVKDFAIFYKVNDDEFIHIKSGQKLTVIDRAIVGDYCVERTRPYFEEYVAYIREVGQTKNTKMSKHFLDLLETAENVELVGGPIPKHELFGA